MNYASLIVKTLLENEETEPDIGMSMNQFVSGSMYDMWWEYSNSRSYTTTGPDEASPSIKDPPLPYGGADKKPVWLRINSLTPKFIGDLTFRVRNTDDSESAMMGSVRMSIRTKSAVYGYDYAEKDSGELYFPTRLWPELRRMCEEFLSKTVRNTFQHEGRDKVTGKLLTTSELSLKLQARFRKMIKNFKLTVYGVSSDADLKNLQKEQQAFKAFVDETEGMYDWVKASEDNPGLETDYDYMRRADIAFWKKLAPKYATNKPGKVTSA